MSDRYLLIGTSYILCPSHFDLIAEHRPKKTHLSPTKYLQTLHKQGNFKPGHRKNFSYDINASKFSIKDSPKERKLVVCTGEKRENSPHFCEDISFINNKSNTYCGDEASSIIETISAMKEGKRQLDTSDIKESGEETNDITDDRNKTPDGKERKTSEIADDRRKNTRERNLQEHGKKSIKGREMIKTATHETPIQSTNIEHNEEKLSILHEEPINIQKNIQAFDAHVAKLNEEPIQTKNIEQTKENVNSFDAQIPILHEESLQSTNNGQNQKQVKAFDAQLPTLHEEPIQIKPTFDPQIPILHEEPHKEIQEQENNNESQKPAKIQEEPPIENKVATTNKTTNQQAKKEEPTNLNSPQKPKVIDRSRQRKEEFDRKLKEQAGAENKLQALKQKFQSPGVGLKDLPSDENANKPPLTPKETNIPEKKLDMPEKTNDSVEKINEFEALEKKMKERLADLQKTTEKREGNEGVKKEKEAENKKEEAENTEESGVISLKDYRDKLKIRKAESAVNNENKQENKYFVNNRGQKINKNLSSIIEQLEKTFGGSPGSGKTTDRDSSNLMEHLTLERSLPGHKRMKSKNTDFFDNLI